VHCGEAARKPAKELEKTRVPYPARAEPTGDSNPRPTVYESDLLFTPSLFRIFSIRCTTCFGGTCCCAPSVRLCPSWTGSIIRAAAGCMRESAHQRAQTLQLSGGFKALDVGIARRSRPSARDQVLRAEGAMTKLPRSWLPLPPMLGQVASGAESTANILELLTPYGADATCVRP
jgi:hypothetical protein